MQLSPPKLLNAALNTVRELPNIQTPSTEVQLRAIVFNGDEYLIAPWGPKRRYAVTKTILTDGRFHKIPELTSGTFAQVIADQDLLAKISDEKLAEAALLYCEAATPRMNELLIVNRTLALLTLARHGVDANISTDLPSVSPKGSEAVGL